MRASVIIPTKNAGTMFSGVLERVCEQEYTSYEIIVIDSGSMDLTLKTAEKFGCRIQSIKPSEFSHGRARNLGAKLSKGMYLVFLTQDALPLRRDWLEKLTGPLQKKEFAGVFGRQIPRANASPMERFFYMTHFPEQRVIRPFPNTDKITLHNIFFSNVNSAIKKSVWMKYPFDNNIIMSEDQAWAKKVLNAGYKTIYEPEAPVMHSHKYSIKTAFQRYFDSAYSLNEVTEEKFRNFTLNGLVYTLKEARYVIRTEPVKLPYLLFYDTSKVLGSFCGKHAHLFPKRLKRAFSMHKYYWV